ncbi:MAG: hypothetical protein JWQ98_1408 [Chlorobi bacterium]|nr:hypothetical protein [Chlorobiota bacterium]
MNRLYLAAFLLVSLTGLSGCFGMFGITRTESDLYTITKRDTTIRQDVRNAPGDRDNGTIYPSPRTVEISRTYVQLDSTVNRYYPDFLRFGVLETAGFIGIGQSDSGGGNGIFGIYKSLELKSPDSTKIFGSAMYRVLPYERVLHAFNDAPDWTVGTAAYETFVIQKDNNAAVSPDERLSGVLPLYVRKRFFLRDKPPYVMVVPFFGVGLLPSQYVNLGATIDVGSYGGFNLRAYAGYVAGSTLAFRDRNTTSYDVNFPYFGIGVSALDFVYKNEELNVEWKDQKHSAIEVSAFEADLVYATSPLADSIPARLTDTSNGFPTGFIVKLATATYPLPFADGHFFVGTSFLNVMKMSSSEIALGFLPIRAGYRVTLIKPDLNLEPFAELTYYPSTIYHVGVRASLKIYDWTQLSVMAGYVNGTPHFERVISEPTLQGVGDFSTFYLGVGIGLGDVFHTPEEVIRP